MWGAMQAMGDWPPGEYFTDGSGGELTSYPLVRRCGVGIACLGPGLEFAWGCYGALSGEQQTVPRAELAAALIVLEQVACHNDISFVIDSEITVKLMLRFLKHPHLPLYEGANFDLWARFRTRLALRTGCTTVRWVKSHPTAEHIAHFKLEKRVVLGNAAADVMADLAATEARVAIGDKERHVWEVAAAKAIQRRLLAVHGILLSELKKSEAQRPEKQQLDVAKSLPAWSIASQHRLVASQGAPAGVWCSRCSATPEKAELQDWLRLPCVDSGQQALATFDGCTSAAGLQVVVAGRPLHPTHKLFVVKGVFFCSKCGGYSVGRKPQGLVKQCEPPTEASRKRLASLWKRMLPSGLDEWPTVSLLGRRSVALS